MKQTIYSFLLIALFGMTGMQAWAQDLSTTEIEGVTYYEIASADNLVAFASLVNNGEAGANAVLTADIALTNVWEAPITNYSGIFDGQGHKITGFETECSSDGGGLFGYTTNATIKNFSIDGKLSAIGGTGAGVVGYPASSVITNIHSSLEIDVPVTGVHHVGGVVGSARGGNTISTCTFSGTMQVAAGSTDNFAGVVAYLGGDSVVFCANYGEITFSDVNCAAGGVAGYLNNNNSYVKNCLNMGSVICDEPEATPKYGSAIVGRLRTHDLAKLTGNCWLEGSAPSAGKDNDGNINLTQANCITAEQLASGEACYLLNGDQSIIGWYQTLPTDVEPTLDATHAQVYMVGRRHCNGDLYEGSTFTNTDTETVQDDHDFVDGFCSYCGIFNDNFLTPNADGFYEIATAKQLAWFEKLVNRGEDKANAVLTADIDFAELTEDESFVWTPIGSWVNSAAYRGHFDGQGHTIKNFNVSASQNYFGIFGVVSEGVVIENFDIEGSITVNGDIGYAASVVAYARDSTLTITGVHSKVDINSTSTAGTPRLGGLVGGCPRQDSKVIIDRCTYSGTLNANDKGGNYGGIVGYILNNNTTIVDITNCLFDGKLKGTVNSNSAQYGGIIGYTRKGIVTLSNCLSVGTFEYAEGNAMNIGQLVGRITYDSGTTGITLTNNYYKNTGYPAAGTSSGGPGNGTAPVEVTDAQLASGEICWNLNEESFIDPVWRQTIGYEDYPVPMGDGAIVFETPGGFDCISDAESFESFRDNIIAVETAFVENTVAYTALLEEYTEEIGSWESIDNYNDFIAAYKASMELKDAIKLSAANYDAYVHACAAVATYMEENSLEGEWATLLANYLNESVEPGSDYPNGSYSYVMDYCNLDDEQILAEIAFVNQLLENAIAGGITAGTEVTRLLVNPTFANSFEGWTDEHDGGSTVVGGKTDIMPVAEAYNNNSVNISQTISEMPNGIYMMKANGLFRAGTDITSQYYAGQLYMNGTVNYFMTQGEDVISYDDAEPGVNCLGEGGDADYVMDDITGWVPNSRDACSVAFKAGRYMNYCATEVTDGTLTVGMRNLGTGLVKDWMPFGDVHVYYLGTADEADEKLADVLQEYVARAQVIVDFFWSDDPNEFAMYPNMSEELKGQLEDAIADVETAETGKDKMELIGTFSDLFNQVLDCRKAYIAMFDKANSLFDFLDTLIGIDLITQEEYNEWSDLILEVQAHYMSGDISTEEAEALAEKLNIVDQMLTKDEENYYQISTAQQLQLFALMVNNGQNDAKAVLTADIDMSELTEILPIGTTTYPYKGYFDGQGHKITGFGTYDEEGEFFTLTLSGDAQGLFGKATSATIRNFSIDGAFQYNGGTGYGVIGWAEGCMIRDIHSTLTIASAATSHHIGGVCGDMRAGSKAYNCSFSGIITDTHNSHDCIGGIGGYSNENCLYENCANYGTVLFSNAGAYAAGICGYVNNDSFVGVNNCLNVGAVKTTTDSAPTYGGVIVGRLRGHANSTFNNNYWLAGSGTRAYGDQSATATSVNDEQLKSGEICYKLNEGQVHVNWFQTLATDDYPMLLKDHLQVFFYEGEYTNIDPDAIADVKASESERTGIYNLAGQRLEKMQKGINIVGGRKILVK
ncbi:MAG: hypothetical protein IJ537_01670 [Bacteroidaceae bacterium]|nr:hypothetical protein [Bacteroidaceae bacterium]